MAIGCWLLAIGSQQPTATAKAKSGNAQKVYSQSYFLTPLKSKPACSTALRMSDSGAVPATASCFLNLLKNFMVSAFIINNTNNDEQMI